MHKVAVQGILKNGYRGPGKVDVYRNYTCWLIKPTDSPSSLLRDNRKDCSFSGAKAGEYLRYLYAEVQNM